MVLKVKTIDNRGRAIEIRVRSNRRVAIRESELSAPPPGTITLRCMGEELVMRYISKQFGYVVYYVPAASWRRLLFLLTQYYPLPCVLVTPQAGGEAAYDL
jgi:hypothetical protein